MSSDIASSQFFTESVRLTDHTDKVTGMSWSPDGNYFASCTHNGVLQLHSSRNMYQLRFTRNPARQNGGGYTSVAWSPDGQFLATGLTTGEIEIWKSNKLIKVEHRGGSVRSGGGSAKGIRCIDWGNGNDQTGFQLAHAGENNLVYFKKFHHDTLTNQEIGLGHVETIHSIAWLPNDHLVVTGTELGTIGVWNLSESDTPLTNSSISQVSLEPDQQYNTLRTWLADNGLTGSIDSHGQQLIPLRTLLCWQGIRAHSGPVNTLAWSEQNQWLASGGANQLRLWDIHEELQVNEFKIEIDDEILDIEFTFNGKILVIQTLEYLYFLRSEDLREIVKYSLPVDVDPATAIATKLISVDHSARLATRDPKDNAIIIIWEVDYASLLKKTGITQQAYRAISVSIIGEPGSGRSNLAHVITKQPFIKDHLEHPFKVLRLPLSNHQKPDGSDECREIFVWDLPSHMDYVLTQRMHVGDGAIVLMLLSPTPGTEPLHKNNLKQWRSILRRWKAACQDQKVTLIPVVSKCDQFASEINQTHVQLIAEALNVESLFVVSAKTGQGIELLSQAITSDIAWHHTVVSPSVEALDALVQFTQQLRSEKRFLFPIAELYNNFIDAYPFLNEFIDDVEQFKVYIDVLDVRGDAYVFKHSDDILLDSTYFRTYASAMISGADLDHADMGRLPVAEAALGYGKQINIDEKNRLDEPKQQIKLLKLTIEEIIEQKIAQQISTDGINYLVFPKRLTKTRDPAAGRPKSDTNCRFIGAVDEIFASLIVRLLGMQVQYPDYKLWKDEALFTTASGGECGLIMKANDTQDEADLMLYFNEKTNAAEQSQFIEYVRYVLGEDNLILDQLQSPDNLSNPGSANAPANDEIINVFLSSSRKETLDQASVDNIRDIAIQLKKHGIESVNDPQRVAGLTRQEYLDLETTSHVALILLTGGRLTTDQTDEYQRLEKAGCRIIPVMLPNASPKSTVPKRLKEDWEFFVDFRNQQTMD